MATKQAPVRLTIKQLQAGFGGVSDVTIYGWRKKTGNRAQLPEHADGRSVYFKPHEIAAWAKKEGLTFNLDAALKVQKAEPAAKKAPAAKKTAPAKKAARKVPAKAPAAETVE